MFSPRVNLTRIDDVEVAETILPTDNFETQNMEKGENAQAFRMSQGSSGVDLNNLEDPPTGVRHKKKSN